MTGVMGVGLWCPLTTHHSPRFSQHLKDYLNSLLKHPTSTRRSNSYALPFIRLNVFSQFKFHPISLDDTDQTEEDDTVKAIPSTTVKPHGRFDFVIILRGDNAESTGIEGLESLESLSLNILIFVSGTRVASWMLVWDHRLLQILHQRSL